MGKGDDGSNHGCEVREQTEMPWDCMQLESELYAWSHFRALVHRVARALDSSMYAEVLGVLGDDSAPAGLLECLLLEAPTWG